MVNPNDIIVEKSSGDIAETKQQISSNIPLTDGETILWHRESTRGIIHKEVTTEDAVTNKRCLKYDVQNKQVVAQVGIDKMPEVVIMNIHRVNNSLGGGVFLSPRMLGLPIGLYGGPRRGNMNVFGDVSLMVNGSIVMTIENVKDPQGVRQLIGALKRAHLGPRGRMWAAQRMGRPFQRFGTQTGAPDLDQ
jgi:hypothetical protein